MKTIRRLCTIFLSIMLLAGLGCVSAFAATDEYGDEVYEATYTITVYSGKEGTFGGKTEISVPAKYGDSLSINLNGGITVGGKSAGTLNFALDSGSKYYARGLKIAGHDNDETSRMGFQTINTTVTGDQSYSVAYGIRGGLVKYTVNYVADDGTTLLPSEEYYGMPGDYPVVSFQYVDGYAPDAYNLGKTLTSNEADNVFTFTYSRSTLTQEEQQQRAAQPANGNNGNNGANANGANGNAANGTGAGAANADGTTIGDNQTPAAGSPNVVDLDNGDVPLADPDDTEDPGELSQQRLMALIIGGLCLVALIAAIIALIARRRNADDEDEDEEDAENEEKENKEE